MASPEICPRCGSSQVLSRNYARKACGVLGAIAGAASATLAFEKQNDESPRLPVEALIGAAAMSVAVPVLNALIGGAAGCATGASVGSAIDDIVLNNYECLACGTAFSRSKT